MDADQVAPMDSGSEPIISDLIDITIKTIDSKNFQFQVENDIQIKAFKERIAGEVGIDTESQRMIFCGRVLSDEKTLKEYNIDNGKTIHLVKKAAPAQQQRNNGAANGNQSNDPNQQNRFTSYRSEDGSVFMGTIQLDSPNGLINQMVRSIFTGSRAGGSTAASGDDSNSASAENAPSGNESIRTRINYVHRFLNYINTNFQILENPNLFPTPATAPILSSEPQVFAQEYSTLFREVFAVADRIRPHITNSYAFTAETSEADARTSVQNHSVLMRIMHHLSHIIHMLSEFNIDTSAPNFPLTLNTLDTMPSNSFLANLPNLSARIEISTPTSSSAAQHFMPMAFSGGVPTSAAGGRTVQSPVVLMEVDTNVSHDLMQELRNSLGSRLGQPTAPQSASSTSSTTSATTTTTNNNSTFTNNTTNTTNTTTTTTSATNNPNNNNTEGGVPSGAGAAQGNSASANSGHHHHHHHMNMDQLSMGLTFDPFLSCNSSYTIPEVRSASAMNMENFAQQVGANGEHSAAAGNANAGMSLNDYWEEAMNTVRSHMQGHMDDNLDEDDDEDAPSAPPSSDAVPTVTVTTTVPLPTATAPSAANHKPISGHRYEDDDEVNALYDSESEFSDAISDFPTTSNNNNVTAPAPKPIATSATSTSSFSGTDGVPSNWQAIVPNEWIPVIEADIQRQKSSTDTDLHQQQPTFSDAYISGMPKKRRLEHKPDEDEQKHDAKQQRPHYPL